MIASTVSKHSTHKGKILLFKVLGFKKYKVSHRSTKNLVLLFSYCEQSAMDLSDSRGLR